MRRRQHVPTPLSVHLLNLPNLPSLPLPLDARADRANMEPYDNSLPVQAFGGHVP
jgi:hypothetical protein